MGNIIEAQLKVAGIERVSQQLRDLDKLSSTLTGGKGSLSGGAAVLKAAFDGMSAATRKLNPQLEAMFAEATRKGTTQGMAKAIAAFPFAAFLNQTMGIGAGQNRPGRKAYEEFWKRAVPAEGEWPLELRRKWGLSRMPFAGGGGFGGSGIIDVTPIPGTGGPSGGAVLGRAVSGFLNRHFLALAAASAAVAFTFKELASAVKSASKLYTDAARVGKSPGRLGITQGALGAIGLSGGQIEQLMLQGEFGRFNRGRGTLGRKTVDAAGEILASGRGILQQGEIQQIQNMSKYLNQFVQESQLAGKVFQETSKQLFETGFAFDGLKREWKTFWTLLASEMSVALKPILRGLGAGLHAVNLIIEHSPNFWLLKQFMPKGDDFQQQFGNGGLRSLNTSSMQRIGFGFGGQATQVNYARRTAEGIEKLVNVVTKPQKKSQTPFPGFSPYYNMP